MLPLIKTTPGSSSGGGAVSSVFGRAGDVVAAANDYTAAQIANGAALTQSNDTNVTITLGGTPAAALLAATSLTMGWTGQLGLARGGSNADLSGTGGANQFVRQNSAGGAFTVSALATGDLPSGSIIKPVSVASQWYTLHDPGHPFIVTANAPVAGSVYYTPFYIGTKVTISSLAFKITTVGTSNFILAVYANNAGVPGALLANTALAGTANTSAALTSAALAANVQLAPGFYWLALQQNDTSVRYIASAINGSATTAVESWMGNATLSNLLSTNSHFAGYSQTGTFGTLPNPAASLSVVNSLNFCPYGYGLINSVP